MPDVQPLAADDWMRPRRSFAAFWQNESADDFISLWIRTNQQYISFPFADKIDQSFCPGQRSLTDIPDLVSSFAGFPIDAHEHPAPVVGRGSVQEAIKQNDAVVQVIEASVAPDFFEGHFAVGDGESQHHGTLSNISKSVCREEDMTIVVNRSGTKDIIRLLMSESE